MKKRIASAGIGILAGAMVAYWVTLSTASPEIATCSSPARQIVPDDWPHRESLTGNLEAIATDIPIPSFTAGGARQFEYLKDGQLFVDRRGPIQRLDDVRWDDEDHGRYYSTQLHGLVGIGTVFELGDSISDEKAAAIGDHILNWGHCAAHNPGINSRAWYEGTVIKRQSNLLLALQYMAQGGELGDLSIEKLLYLIDANAAYLLDTDDVYAIGNHGIRQDMLLAATALTLPHHPRADEMLQLAKDRLEEAAVDLFTGEGIWMEHAPGYVHYALRLMDDVRNLHKASDRFSPALFLSRYDSSLDYLLSSLLPDGLIPYVGSSGAWRISMQITDQEHIDAFLTTKERSLSTFPGYGHAIVRGDLEDGLYLLFVASQNLPAGKRHSDDLSFLLYKYGRPWISEGGHQSYELTGMTSFLPSPFAHNTYVLDNEHLGENQRPDLKTELIDARKNGDQIVLAGYTERFTKPARFERRIEVDDFSTLSITDTVQGDGAWEGRLQLPGDLEVLEDDGAVVATASDGTQMILLFASDTPLSFSTCFGEEDPICGWATAGHDFGPATTLMWSFDGDAEVTIAIKWDVDQSID